MQASRGECYNAEIRNALDTISIRLDVTEEKVSEPEDIATNYTK